MSALSLRCGGNLVEFSQNGGPLPADLFEELCAQMRYTHIVTLRGEAAYDSFGHKRPTRTEVRLMYKITDKGRMVASIGWKYRMKRVATDMGYTVVESDTCPPHPRPDRYRVDWDRMFRVMDLRVKQDLMLTAMETHPHGLMHVPAGVGKTFVIGAYALSHPNARIHVVTDGLDIIQRIKRDLIRFVPNVGQVGGGKCQFGPHVTILSADSLHKIGEGFDDPRAKSAPDVVIFDEVHKAGAETTIRQLAKYQRARMYGLSANIGDRFDGADAQLEGVFGEVIFSMSYQEAQSLGLVAPVIVDWVKMDFEARGLADLSDSRFESEALWCNERRNRKFAERMLQFDDDTQCLVMVATVTHAVQLKQFLPGYKLCYDSCKDYQSFVRNGLLDPTDEPPMTAKRRDQMRRAFEAGELKKVIATDVWSTGVDFSALGVLGRADGRDSRIMDTQIPGRANRTYEGKEYATIIDCMDMFSDRTLRRSNNRKRTYAKYGWTQTGLASRRPGVEASRLNGG